MKQFKVYEKQISHEKIDLILDQHKNFKKSSLSFFRAQGTTNFERPILDKYKNQINSIHNPHLLGFQKKFSNAISEILINEEVYTCLNDFFEFDGNNQFVHFQSMFFDKSTSTKLHKDTWYLDTYENTLVGVWIALEDISMDAGPFCLYSNTDTIVLDPKSLDYENIENNINFKNKFQNVKRFDFCARKGDILIWNSKVLHGSLSNKNPEITRKSITSHYYPYGGRVIDPPVKRFINIYAHNKPKKTKSKNFYQAATINPFLYQLMCAVLFYAGEYKNFLVRDHLMDKNLKNIRKIK